MTVEEAVRTVRDMGTNMYGSYDSLVIELRGLDRWRTGRREVRIPLDDVWRVRSADPRTLVSWHGERVLRARRVRGGEPVVVLDLAPTAAEFDRVVLAIRDAEQLAADLRQWGVAAPPSTVVARELVAT
jgi:hypothetical protein